MVFCLNSKNIISSPLLVAVVGSPMLMGPVLPSNQQEVSIIQSFNFIRKYLSPSIALIASTIFTTNTTCRGGQVVSTRALNSDDPSSNSVDIEIFIQYFCKKGGYNMKTLQGLPIWIRKCENHNNSVNIFTLIAVSIEYCPFSIRTIK